jgi:hypothetical protein
VAVLVVLAAVFLAVTEMPVAVSVLAGKAPAALVPAQVVAFLLLGVLLVAPRALAFLRPACLAQAVEQLTLLLELWGLAARSALSGVPIGHSRQQTRGTYDSTISGRVYH